MRKEYIAFAFSACFFATTSFVAAASIFDIEFPIPELGSCTNKNECKTYCDDSLHRDVCIEFGKAHGLVSPEDAQKIKNLPQTGPGGCRGSEECKTYCDDPAHQEECLQFAELHGFLNKDQIARAREFLGKTGPGGCRGAPECRTYCADQTHQEECLEFAHRQGLVSDKGLENGKKLIGKPGPGGCRGEECKTYCKDPLHTDECVKFAEENGFISKEEAARIKKFGITTGPGGCKREECKTYCKDLAHQEECISFAEKNSFMSHEEAERARKFAGKLGPGGCMGEECKEYCHDPSHTEACVQFAVDNGLLSPEELEKTKNFLRVSEEGGPGGCRGEECKRYCQDQTHREECYAFAKEKGLIHEKDERGFQIGQQLNRALQEKGGPGGCGSENECRAYCSDSAHTEECIAFAAAHAGVSEEEARSMLKQFTEKHLEETGEFRPPEDLERFKEEQLQRFEEFKQLEQQFRGPGIMPFTSQPLMASPQKPGEFQQNEQGGKPFGEGFVGPGGCTSPTECIHYCLENKKECFKEIPQRGHGVGGMSNIIRIQNMKPSQQEMAPQLRTNLLKKFNSSQFPPQQFNTQQEKEEFYKKKLEELQRQGGFPQNIPQRFPGQTGGIQNFQNQHQYPPKPGLMMPYPAGQPRPLLEGIKPIQGTPGIFNPLMQRPYGTNQPALYQNSTYPQQIPPPGSSFEGLPPPTNIFPKPPVEIFPPEPPPLSPTSSALPKGIFARLIDLLLP